MAPIVSQGRAFYYYQDDDLNATNYFLKQAGNENPEASNNVFGGSFGGPIVKNKAFWFANAERTLIQEAANLNFPADAAPLAVSYSDTTDFTGWNTFVRGDYQMTTNNHLSFRWLRESVLTENDELEGNESTPDNATFENDSGDQVFSFAATSVLRNTMTNEFRVGHVRENLLQGPRIFFDDSWNFIGLDGREQFDLGSMNTHPDYNAGNRNNYQEDLIRSIAVDDSFTWFKSGWGGDHTFKAGIGWSRNAALPQGTAGDLVGRFDFTIQHRLRSCQRADLSEPLSHPAGTDRVHPEGLADQLLPAGQMASEQADDAESWPPLRLPAPDAGNQECLLAAAWPRVRPGGKREDAVAGRFWQVLPAPSAQRYPGVADRGGDRTLVRLRHGGGPVAGETGVIPVHTYTGFGFNGVQTGCLQPTGSSGLALIGPQCRAFLTQLRQRVLDGGYVNNQPTLDGDRRMPYLWAFSVGMKQQIGSYLAVSADYVGNRGRDQVAQIDINEGPPGANGRITRLASTSSIRMVS